MYLTDRQPTLRPSDVVVACQLAATPAARFTQLAEQIGLSAGECHNAVRRLGMAGLLSPGSRRPVTDLFVRFLVHGVPHAFPAVVGPAATGVPTAQSAPVFAGKVAVDEGFVWPDADGTARGLALLPLFPRAAATATRNPRLYDLLAAIDALRVGHARERKIAEELLQERLAETAA